MAIILLKFHLQPLTHLISISTLHLNVFYLGQVSVNGCISDYWIYPNYSEGYARANSTNPDQNGSAL